MKTMIATVLLGLMAGLAQAAEPQSLLRGLTRVEIRPQGRGLEVWAWTTKGNWHCQIPEDVSLNIPRSGTREVQVPMKYCQQVCWRSTAVGELPQCDQ